MSLSHQGGYTAHQEHTFKSNVVWYFGRIKGNYNWTKILLYNISTHQKSFSSYRTQTFITELCKILSPQKCSEDTSRKWAWNTWLLLHNKAPGHWSLMVKKYLAKHNVTALVHPPYSPDLSPPNFSCSRGRKNYLKGQQLRAPRKSLQKQQEHYQTNRGNSSKSFKNVGKSVSLPKGTTLKEMLCKICKVIYFCVIHQFWELFEASSNIDSCC
jgi:hypothetical protein